MTRVLVGSLFDEDDTDQTESVLSDMSTPIKVGPAGLLANLCEQDDAAIEALAMYLRGAVVRRSAVDVELELAAAEAARYEAKEEAAGEPREARSQEPPRRGRREGEALPAQEPSRREVLSTPPETANAEEERCLTTT